MSCCRWRWLGLWRLAGWWIIWEKLVGAQLVLKTTKRWIIWKEDPSHQLAVALFTYLADATLPCQTVSYRPPKIHIPFHGFDILLAWATAKPLSSFLPLASGGFYRRTPWNKTRNPWKKHRRLTSQAEGVIPCSSTGMLSSYSSISFD